MTRADARRSVESIIEAARDALSEDPAASAEAIIARSGVHRATFYRHFSSREALALAIYDRYVERVAEIVRQSDAVAAPDEALERIARGIIAQTRRDRVFLYVAPRGRREDNRHLFDAVRRHVDAAREQGLIRSDESADSLHRAYYALVIGLGLTPGGDDAAESARLVMSLLRGRPDR